MPNLTARLCSKNCNGIALVDCGVNSCAAQAAFIEALPSMTLLASSSVTRLNEEIVIFRPPFEIHAALALTMPGKRWVRSACRILRARKMRDITVPMGMERSCAISS